MKTLYSLLLYLSSPLLFTAFAVRGLRAPAYRRRWRERLGFFPPLSGKQPVWVHAASVGEVQAALPLIHALRDRFPSRPVLVTTFTPTGYERLRSACGEEVLHRFQPFDLPGAVKRFMNRTDPCLAVIMETELWPNLLGACAQRQMPVVLANARLSARSFRVYKRIAALMALTLGYIDAVAARSEEDAARLGALGVAPGRLTVMGNIKFDLVVEDDLAVQAAPLREAWAGRPVWIAASTRAGEDVMVLDAFAQIRRTLPTALLMLVPRHPERFAEAARLCRERGYAVALRSAGAIEGTPDVFVGDSVGELMLFYAAADVAFIGGSLVPVGGQNPLEAAALGLPVVVGPYVDNFRDVVPELLAAGAGRQASDATELAEAVCGYLSDALQRHVAGEKGRTVVAANRGALDRLMSIVDRFTATSC